MAACTVRLAVAHSLFTTADTATFFTLKYFSSLIIMRLIVLLCQPTVVFVIIAGDNWLSQ